MVSVLVHSPEWFFGVDSSLEACSALIAFLVAIVAYKIFRATKEKKYGFFSASFVLLTLSFIARAIADTVLEEIFDVEMPQSLAPHVFAGGYITHILLALTAYLILVFVTHKITDKRIITLFFLTMIPTMLLSGSYFLTFYGLSLIFLTFITIAYFQNYRKVRNLASFFVFVGFLAMAVAQIWFLLEVFYKPLYVGAQITQALGYLLLLFALVKTLLKPRDFR
jgi:hypothetical protein